MDRPLGGGDMQIDKNKEGNMVNKNQTGTMQSCQILIIRDTCYTSDLWVISIPPLQYHTRIIRALDTYNTCYFTAKSTY
jgi:hypothetical protein